MRLLSSRPSSSTSFRTAASCGNARRAIRHAYRRCGQRQVRVRFGAAADSAITTPDRNLDLGSGDTIDLSGIDANVGAADDQSFNFIGGGAFSNTAG